MDVTRIMSPMRTALLAVLLTSAAVPQENPQIASSKAMFDQVKGNILKSAEKMPDDKLGFRPVDDVRTFGQLLGMLRTRSS